MASVVKSERVIVAAEAIVRAFDENVNAGSVAPESKTQLIAEPDPQVVVPISVESKFKVTVEVVPESETTVSMPFVPPTMSTRSPEAMAVSEPVSAPRLKV